MSTFFQEVDSLSMFLTQTSAQIRFPRSRPAVLLAKSILCRRFGRKPRHKTDFRRGADRDEASTSRVQPLRRGRGASACPKTACRGRDRALWPFCARGPHHSARWFLAMAALAEFFRIADSKISSCAYLDDAPRMRNSSRSASRQLLSCGFAELGGRDATVAALYRLQRHALLPIFEWRALAKTEVTCRRFTPWSPVAAVVAEAAASAGVAGPRCSRR